LQDDTRSIQHQANESELLYGSVSTAHTFTEYSKMSSTQRMTGDYGF
jgi:hypothetical protein